MNEIELNEKKKLIEKGNSNTTKLWLEVSSIKIIGFLLKVMLFVIKMSEVQREFYREQEIVSDFKGFDVVFFVVVDMDVYLFNIKVTCYCRGNITVKVN